jgi:formylglycine-generating enzyme required for sulfatase activity
VIPAAFPKGFQAFYIMKYELTQEAWCDWINTLDFARQDAHVQANLNATAVGHNPWGNTVNGLLWYRNGIVCTKIGESYEFGCNLNGNAVYNERSGTTGGEDERNLDGQDVAVNFVSWYDLLAYADFAGLRPMTELEYEKACRGQLTPVANEFAWGNVFLKIETRTWNTYNSNTSYRGDVLQTPNTGDERFATIYNATAIHGMWIANDGGCSTGSWWWSWQRLYACPSPTRVGAFADSTTNRQASGGSYWGVMNMSDNVSELCVNAVNSAGYAFQGWHGDGMLLPNGDPHSDHGFPTADSSYISRGIRMYGNSFITADYGCAHNNNYTANWTNSSNVHNAIYDVNAGRISDRHAGTWRIDWKNRNPMALGATGYVSTAPQGYMAGIRCVRTQGAIK